MSNLNLCSRVSHSWAMPNFVRTCASFIDNDCSIFWLVNAKHCVFYPGKVAVIQIMVFRALSTKNACVLSVQIVLSSWYLCCMVYISSRRKFNSGNPRRRWKTLLSGWYPALAGMENVAAACLAPLLLWGNTRKIWELCWCHMWMLFELLPLFLGTLAFVSMIDVLISFNFLRNLENSVILTRCFSDSVW